MKNPVAQIVMSPELFEALKAQAALERRGLSTIVRTLVSEYLAKQPETK